MQQLVHKQRVPYGGRYLIDAPDRGFVGSGNSFEALLESVKKYRLANGLPNGLSIEPDLEQIVCEKYPQECEEKDPAIPRKRKLSVTDVIHGTKLMIMHKLAGSPLVSDEVAIARAAICVNCPYKTQFTRPCGGGCGDLPKIVKAVIGSKSTPLDEKLEDKVCSICGCFIKVSVWVPTDLQVKVLDEDQKAQFRKVQSELYPSCWKTCLINPP